jgi:hypothetical protein
MAASVRRADRWMRGSDNSSHDVSARQVLRLSLKRRSDGWGDRFFFVRGNAHTDTRLKFRLLRQPRDVDASDTRGGSSSWTKLKNCRC